MKPCHSLQEAVDRILLHCSTIAQAGAPADQVEELRQVANHFSLHFVTLDRVRWKLAQLTERLEQP